MALGGHLSPLTANQKSWAYRQCVEHYAYRHPISKKITCMDCGEQWHYEGNEEKCRCPHCNAQLNVVDTYVRTNRQKSCFNILTTCGGYQVLRIFFLFVELRKGMQANPAYLEVGQYWLNSKGKAEVRAIRKTLGYYLDSFAFGSPMEIRKDDNVYRQLADQWLYPRVSVIPELKRNGFTGDCHDINPIRLMSSLLTNPVSETMMKSGDYDALKYSLEHYSNWNKFWSSYKVAKRHGY